MASKSLVDNLKDKDKIIKQINKNGFDILKKYNLVDIDYDKNDKFINYMKFEIKENPLFPIYCDEYDDEEEDNDGYEDNGII